MHELKVSCYFTFIDAGKFGPNNQIDFVRHESDRRVSPTNVAATRMLGEHLSDVIGRKVDGMNDWKTRDVKLPAGWSGMHEYQRGSRIRAVFWR